jgi:translation initiation factor IF-1
VIHNTEGRVLLQQNRLIKFDGSIVEVIEDALYRVRFSDGYEIVAHAADNVKGLLSSDLAAERITVEISPHDSSTGRLVFRHGT